MLIIRVKVNSNVCSQSNDDILLHAYAIMSGCTDADSSINYHQSLFIEMTYIT